MERVLHRPDLESRQILRALDRPVPGHEVPESGFEVAEEDESPLPERRLEAPADGAVEHLVHVGPVAEQVGQVEHQQLGREGGERGVRGGGEFHGPDDREFDDVPFVPERVVRVDLDRDTAAGRRGDLALEDLKPLDGGLICRGARAGLDRDAASSGGRHPANRIRTARTGRTGRTEARRNITTSPASAAGSSRRPGTP